MKILCWHQQQNQNKIHEGEEQRIEIGKENIAWKN